MNKLMIAVCDDDESALSIIAGTMKTLLDKKNISSEVYEFLSVRDLKKSQQLRTYDLLLLDISMGKEDGIRFAKQLREDGDLTDIVFVSSNEDRVFESFDVKPLAFVRKKQFLNDIQKMLDAYLAGMNSKKSPKTVIELKTCKDVEYIDAEDIAYVESDLEKQCLYLIGEEKPTVLLMTMAAIEEELKKFDFVQIHRCILVNMKHISRISECEVHLTDGKVLYMARRRGKEVREAYLKYNREKVSAVFRFTK